LTNFNSQDQPSIAVSPNGDAIAVWYRVVNNKLNMWSARLPAGSSTWGPEIRVTSNQTTQKQTPRVTFGSNGTAYAVWMDPAVGNADICTQPCHLGHQRGPRTPRSVTIQGRPSKESLTSRSMG
jgi:hypothetical protein